MTMEKVTSKTSLLNSMLLRAWRERWTDSQWGINIKKVLPRGVSGDVYNLAECILKQAVVGSDANKLVLSYMKHSLCSHLISYAAVLKEIAKFDGYNKPYCLLSLFEFLDSIIDGVTCRGKQDESYLCNAVLQIVNWLIHIMRLIVENHQSAKTVSHEDRAVLEKAAKILEKILSNQFLLGCIWIAKHDTHDLYALVQMQCSYILKHIINTSMLLSIEDNESYFKSLRTLSNIRINDMSLGHSSSVRSATIEHVSYCVQPYIAVHFTLDPGGETQQYVAQMIRLKDLKGYTWDRLFYEIIRSCWISLYSVVSTNTTDETLWGAFALLKMPDIIKTLCIQSLDISSDNEMGTNHLVKGMKMFLEDSTIIDLLDTKLSCSSVNCLLNEFIKLELLNEQDVRELSSIRESVIQSLNFDLGSLPGTITKYILNAESPLTGILLALESDYNSIQKTLIEVLCQMLTGNGLQLICSAAIRENKLKRFIVRLIYCNECSKQSSNDVMRSALFDVSFVILTYIAQTFGSDVVLKYGEGFSFIEKWIKHCMVEQNKRKSPMQMVADCDLSKVEELILHLHENTLNSSSLKWYEICTSIPGVLHQVLLAWEKQDALTNVMVRKIIENLKNRLCCYSICAVSWICNYLQVVRDDELIKPQGIITEFLKPLELSDDSAKEKHHIKESFAIASQLMQKMHNDTRPKNIPKIGLMPNAPNDGVSLDPMEREFLEIWNNVKDVGYIPVDKVKTLNNLLTSCGPFWFVSKLINEIIICKYRKDAERIMNIVFALMHLDIEGCTSVLLSEVLPILLLNRSQFDELVEPNSIVLAELCVYCILSVIDEQNTSRGVNEGSKRSSNDMMMDETGESIGFGMNTKMRKLHSDGFTATSVTSYWIKDPILDKLHGLFKSFDEVVSAAEITPKTYFVYHFYMMLVQNDERRIRPVLALLPNGFIQNLIKTLVVDDMSVGLVLRLHDMDTPSGRISAISDLSLLRNMQLRISM